MFRCWFCLAVLCIAPGKLGKKFWPCCIKRQKTAVCAQETWTSWMCWVSGKSYQVKPLAMHYGWEQSVEALSDPPSTCKVGFAGPIHRAHGKLGLRGLRCFRWCWLTFASRFCGWRGSACKVWKARVSHIGFSTSRMFSHGHCWNRLWPSEVAFASVFFWSRPEAHGVETEGVQNACSWARLHRGKGRQRDR